MVCNSIITCFKNNILITIDKNIIYLAVLCTTIHCSTTYRKSAITTLKNYRITESLKWCYTNLISSVMKYVCCKPREHLIKLTSVINYSTLKTKSSRCLLVNSPRT